MVTAKLQNQMSALVKTDHHQLVSGIAERLGGKDEGPAPQAILESALAACTVLALQSFAHKKNWNLVSSEVKVEVITEGRKTHFNRMIKLIGDLNQEQEQRLLAEANDCNMHNLLLSSISIHTKLL